MNGLDTNVLTRYFTQDDPFQSAKARHLVEQALIETQPLFINHVVLCELVWVLVRSYRYSKADICAILEKILLAKQFWVENEPLVCNALADFKTSSADFADLPDWRQKSLCRLSQYPHFRPCRGWLVFF